jgi:hypothetical protein
MERKARPSCDSQSLGRSGAGTKLVACHLRRGNVGYGAVGVVVLGTARVLPVRAGYSARRDAGDRVVSRGQPSEGQHCDREFHLAGTEGENPRIY